MTLLLTAPTVWDIPRLCECDWAWEDQPSGPWVRTRVSPRCPVRHTRLVTA